MTYKSNTERSFAQNVVNENNRAKDVLAPSCSMGVSAALNKNASRAPLRSGFTLIELLVVVLIIGILAAVAVPQYQKAVKKTIYAEMLSIVTSIGQAAQRYYLENGTHPTSLSDLDISIPDGYLSRGIRIGFANPIGRIYVTLKNADRTGNGYIYQMTTYGYRQAPPGVYCFQSVTWPGVQPDGMCTGEIALSDANGTLHKVNP